MTGKVKWFNNKKGYGFIVGNDGKDMFVHYSNIKSNHKYKSLQENDTVSYDVETANDKPEAVNVKVENK